jgi:hypothetical protein
VTHQIRVHLVEKVQYMTVFALHLSDRAAMIVFSHCSLLLLFCPLAYVT